MLQWKRTGPNKDYEMEECNVCRKWYRKGKGLKIHQKKSRCGGGKPNSQRKVHKSEVGSIQEKHHSNASGCVNRVKAQTQPKTRSMARTARQVGKDKAGTDTKQTNLDKWLQKGKEEKKKENEIDKRREEKENDPQAIVETFDVKLSQAKKNFMERRMESTKKANGLREEEGNALEKAQEENNCLSLTQKIKDLRDAVKRKEEDNSKAKKETKGDIEAQSHMIKEVKKFVQLEKEEDRNERKEEINRDKGVQEIKDVKVLVQREKENKGETEKYSRKYRRCNRDIREWLQSRDKGEERENEKHRGKATPIRCPNLQKVERGPPEEVLARNNLNMTRSDFRSLAGKNYLNDKIIDEYLLLIKQRNEREENLPDVEACSVFLYQKLDRLGLEEGFRQTENWIKTDLRKKAGIFVPIHKSDHWSLIYIDIPKRTVFYLDSIVGSRKSSAAPGMMKRYMEEYFRRKGEEEIFKVKVRNDIPMQKNGVDCGVFVCQYAERIARNAPLAFGQADMPATRTKMMEEIFQGTIIETPLPKETQTDKRGKKTNGSNAGPKKTEEENKDETANKKESKERQETISWPKANSPEWKSLDEDISKLLRTIYSPPERKAKSHPLIIYQMCKERFGLREKKQKPQQKGPSRRQRKCKELRKDINNLKDAYHQAPREEKDAIQQLQQEKIKHLRLAKRAETIKKNRKHLARNSSRFMKNPFEFARETLAPKPKGKMKSTKEEVENFLRNAHSSEEKEDRKDNPIPIPEDLHRYDEPKVEFKNAEPTWREFSNRLRKTRSKSAPGPNGVPYLVYKRCEKVARLLWQYLKGMWKKNVVSNEWRKAEGIFIPKEEGAETVQKFRTISLLNVEGKLYFALRADRLLNYLLGNGYIDTSIQKGGVPGVSGCLEHTAVLSQMIREAKAGKRNLVVTWLDIANAYGSIPHSIIQVALHRAHVPDEVCKLIESYYSNVKIRFTTDSFTTEWQRVEKGIITGCTLSVVLFTLAMTMLIMSVKDVTKGPKTRSGQRQKNCRLFMDDLTTTTETMVQTNHLLEELASKLNWASLTAKPEKCRSLVIWKGEISNRTLQLNGKAITSITEKPVKYLGKIYNMSLDEKEQIEQTTDQVKRELKMIEKCRVPGRYKGWMVQHMLLPRIMWPLSIYNVPATKVEEIQRKITTSLKKWLGLPKTLSTDCFYSRSAKLQLPYTALTEEVKAAKARNLITLEESRDPCIRKAGISVDGGRKANTPAEIEDARSRLRLKEIAGIANVGREGLGLNHRQNYSSSSRKEKRAMLVREIREMEEEKRKTRMTGLAKQGANTTWEVPERKLSHSDMLQTNEANLKFLVKAVYDLLPTPANKNTWFGTEEKCLLCEGKGTLAHILSGCRVALGQGRYTWRHNEVLKVVAQCVDNKRTYYNSRRKETKKSTITFLKAGEVKDNNKTKGEAQSYLESARDWDMKVDLGRKLKVPTWIAQTELRPDMTLISESTKQMGVIELTVPSEDRVEVSGELKRAKYEIMAEAGRKNGWKVRIWTVEVGCRGFPATSMVRLLKDLGYQGSEKRRRLRQLEETAVRASSHIWKWSHFKEWGSRR